MRNLIRAACGTVQGVKLFCSDCESLGHMEFAEVELSIAIIRSFA